MAQINIIQPALGKLEVVSASETSYTVRFVPPEDQQYTRGNIRLYCEACGHTLIERSSNPAVFDIANLEESGHPGPFDISVDVTGQVTVYVNTYAMDGQGTTDPVTAQYGTVVGGSVDIRLRATPNEGYVFDHWDRLGSTWTSTTQNLNLRVSNVQQDEWRTYRAYFRRYDPTAVTVKLNASQVGESPYNIRETSTSGNPIGVGVYDIFSSWSATFARLYGNDQSVHGGDTVTVRAELLDVTLKVNPQFVIWSVPTGITEYSRSEDGLTLTFKIPENYKPLEAGYINLTAWFTLRTLVDISIRFSSELYGYCYFSHVSEQGVGIREKAILPDREIAPENFSGCKEIREKMPVDVSSPDGILFELSFYLWSYYSAFPEHMTPEARMAFLHGVSYAAEGPASISVTGTRGEYGNITVSGTTSQTKKIDITIVACTHMLVYDSGRNLVSRSNSLVCDCHKPSGGTFIEL